jgi:hypothetical protein
MIIHTGYKNSSVNKQIYSHSFKLGFWVVPEEKYGKKQWSSGCSCTVEWAGRRIDPIATRTHHTNRISGNLTKPTAKNGLV